MQLHEIKALLSEQLPLLARKYAVASLGIFGSYARQDEAPDSDLDLLVTLDRPIDMFKFLELENYLSDLLHLRVDLVTRDALKPRIGKRILAEVMPL